MATFSMASSNFLSAQSKIFRSNRVTFCAFSGLSIVKAFKLFVILPAAHLAPNFVPATSRYFSLSSLLQKKTAVSAPSLSLRQ
jgi:hypothetical protein